MDALALGSQLLKELKKLDDKNLLVEVQLLESKVRRVKKLSALIMNFKVYIYLIFLTDINVRISDFRAQSDF